MDFFTKLALVLLCWGFLTFFGGTMMRDLGVGRPKTGLRCQQIGLACCVCGSFVMVMS